MILSAFHSCVTWHTTTLTQICKSKLSTYVLTAAGRNVLFQKAYSLKLLVHFCLKILRDTGKQYLKHFKCSRGRFPLLSSCTAFLQRQIFKTLHQVSHEYKLWPCLFFTFFFHICKWAIGNKSLWMFLDQPWAALFPNLFEMAWIYPGRNTND